MRLIGGVALATLAVLLSGCGGTTNAAQHAKPSPHPHAISQRQVFNDSEIAHYLHLTGNYTYTAPNGRKCDVAAILNSASAVNMYADAGDTVAANPAGTAGVKVVDAQAATCQRLIAKAMAGFPTN